MRPLELNVGDIIKVDLDKNRYSSEIGYLVVVDGKVVQDGIKWKNEKQ